MHKLSFRQGTSADVPLLAELNQQLQIDESHSRLMQLAELMPRMAEWLATGGYEAVIFERDGHVAGYALFRRERDPEHVYLKQFFVCRECRRQAIGREAMTWLSRHAWQDVPAVYLDVLVNNERGIAFWRAAGFRDYAITMEIRLANASSNFSGGAN
ncbi:MAG TPA: GNAT family N-acetyltransferase [Lacipirellulaceae bacterium]